MESLPNRLVDIGFRIVQTEVQWYCEVDGCHSYHPESILIKTPNGNGVVCCPDCKQKFVSELEMQLECV